MADNLLFDIDPDTPSLQNNDSQVSVLGHTFANDDERREFFRKELKARLPELRKIEGFPIGDDEDIINLSDPPYYTACPNPWLNDFIAEWEKEKKILESEGKRTLDFEVKEPYASDVSEGKNNPIYMAHAYHTKVPHPAIMRYILHYTQPGDIVFDGFCGTGMTGVAANLCNSLPDVSSMNAIDKIGLRHSICSDLSPIASFITYNFNNPVNSKNFIKKAKALINKIKDEYSSYYLTNHTNGLFGTISYVVWSEVFVCPSCNHQRPYATITSNNELEISDNMICPVCGCVFGKGDTQKYFETSISNNGTVRSQNKLLPVLIKYNFEGRSYYKKPDSEDLSIIDRLFEKNINLPLTNFHIPMGVKTGELIRNGRINVTDIYTKRNLSIFAALWQASTNFPLFRFAITSILVKTGSLLHNIGIKNGKINLAGALPNALFIPSVLAERNIFDLLEGKIDDIGKMGIDRFYHICNQIQSATDLCNIHDDSVDYIFTDPPFGHNLMYSELNFIHESWLRVISNNKDEAIENSSQNKSLLSYQVLMTASFREFFRILKPGRWMTVEFSNTSAAVWNTIQHSLSKAGFTIAIVRGLDKQQGSFNAQTTTTAVKQDLVISCYKHLDDSLLHPTEKEFTHTWNFVEEHLLHLPIHSFVGKTTTAIIERNPKILYDRLISFCVERGYNVPIDAHDFQKGLKEHFVERDGMFFTATQAVEYDDRRRQAPNFTGFSLFISSEADGIDWLKNKLSQMPLTYQEIQPQWMQDLVAVKKGDKLPELMDILKENFLDDEQGRWRCPNPEKEVDLEKIRTKRLLKEFEVYFEMATKPKGRIKEARLESLRAGFKHCYQEHDFEKIIKVGNRLPESLLMEDEVLLQYYDIASSRI